MQPYILLAGLKIYFRLLFSFLTIGSYLPAKPIIFSRRLSYKIGAVGGKSTYRQTGTNSVVKTKK